MGRGNLPPKWCMNVYQPYVAFGSICTCDATFYLFITFQHTLIIYSSSLKIIISSN